MTSAFAQLLPCFQSTRKLLSILTRMSTSSTPSSPQPAQSPALSQDQDIATLGLSVLERPVKVSQRKSNSCTECSRRVRSLQSIQGRVLKTDLRVSIPENQMVQLLEISQESTKLPQLTFPCFLTPTVTKVLLVKHVRSEERLTCVKYRLM